MSGAGWKQTLAAAGLLSMVVVAHPALLAQSQGSTQHRLYKAMNSTIERAFKALKAQKFDEARAILAPCLEKIPDHFEAHYFLALMDFEGRDFVSALRHLEVAEAAMGSLERDYLAQVADLKAKAAISEREAQDNLTTVLSRTSDPTGAAATQIAGLKIDLQVAKSQGAPLAGLQNPFQVPADYLFLKGNTLLRLGRREEARLAYRRAVAADPAHANAWNNLIALGLGAKDIQGARADLERAEGTGVSIRPELKKAVLTAR